MPGTRGGGTLQMYALPTSRIGGVSYVVRSAASPEILIPALRRAISAVGPEIAVGATLTGADYIRDSLAPSRFAMALLAAFALLALVLSAIGLYGVIAYTVSQRTRELGVRVALGADSSAVARLIVGGGLRLTAIGVAVGLGGAISTSRALDSMLYGVTASDPATFAAIPILLSLIALIASYLPARRALHIDSIEALRVE